MTTSERQRLSVLTEQAVENNDLESLQEILQIIREDEKEQGFQLSDGVEWFEIKLSPDLHAALFD
jgi:hypothetical protein